MKADNLPKNWKRAKAEDVALPGRGSIVSGPFGSNIGKRFFVDEGVPVIRGNNLTLGTKRFIDEGFVFITKEKARELRNCEAVKGDLIFTAAGTIGQVGLIPNNSKYQKYIISNKQLRLRCDPKVASPQYLYYWFSSPSMREYIINQNTGASIPLITLGTLRNLPMNLPPLLAQSKIAAILSAYDDLIENNTRRIKILEEMAQAIYREWFVNFCFPGHEKVKLVEAPSGKIPEGWEMKRLIDLTDGSRNAIVDGPFGTQMKISEYLDAGIPVVEMPFLEGGIFHKNFNNFISEEKFEKVKRSVTHPGDIVISKTGTLGLLSIMPNEVNKAVIVSRLAKITPNKEKPCRYFIFCGLKELSASGYWNKVATGSTMPILNLSHLKEVQFIVPDDRLLFLFEDMTNTNYLYIRTLKLKNQVLKQTRDLLLPKLISGGVDVSDLDIKTEDVAA